MPKSNLPLKPLLVVLVLSSLIRIAAAGPAEEEFKEAYFQETHEHDLAAATAAYQKVVANAQAPEALCAEAKARLAACQEEESAANLAQLMPPDTTAYIEINRPGEHIGRLLQMLGLSRDPAAPNATSTDAAPLPGGLVLPGNLSVSPALIRELKKVRGFAVSITGVDREGIPSGIAVLHPGDFDLVRGFIETGIQVLPQAEAIAGFNVYRVEDKVWIALTNKLVIVSDARQRLVDTVERLKNSGADSLAKQAAFSRLQPDREGALFFAYVNGRRAMEVAAPHLRGQEAMMARMFLDLERLESVSAAVGAKQDDVHAQVKLVLAEGHRNLAYGMIRTTPITRKSLAHVPAGAAAVALLGLNPPNEANGQTNSLAPTLSAMDIGREVFSNVEEISLFAMPPAASAQRSSPAIPEIGMIAAVKDPAKSEALWEQLLSLAAMFGPQVAAPPKEVEVQGRKAKQYQFAGAPPIVVVRLGDHAIAAGTHGAVAAAIGAGSQTAITADPQFKPLLDGLKPETSKAVLVHAGRLTAMAISAAPREFRDASWIGAIAGDLKFMVATHEKPSEFVVGASVSGLPNVPRTVQASMAQFGNRATLRGQSPEPRRAAPRPLEKQ